ncbi:hypothetical protein BHU09_00685 [Tannerella sp. oral taxon 808]|nr:hypothetical protein BHU09_00685 [Tannerella sp. oral taxon 808]
MNMTLFISMCMHDHYKNRLYILICTHGDLNKVLFIYMCIHEDENNVLFISMCMHENMNEKPMKPLWTIDGLARLAVMRIRCVPPHPPCQRE